MTDWNLGPVCNGLGAEVPPETGWIWLIKNFTYVLGTLAGSLSSIKSLWGAGSLFAADSVENVGFKPLPGHGSLLF